MLLYTYITGGLIDGSSGIQAYAFIMTFHYTKSQKWMCYANQPCLHAGSDWKSAVDDVKWY